MIAQNIRPARATSVTRRRGKRGGRGLLNPVVDQCGTATCRRSLTMRKSSSGPFRVAEIFKKTPYPRFETVRVAMLPRPFEWRLPLLIKTLLLENVIERRLALRSRAARSPKTSRV